MVLEYLDINLMITKYLDLRKFKVSKTKLRYDYS